MTAAPEGNAHFAIDGSRRQGMHLLHRLARQGVRVCGCLQVLGIFPPDRLLVQHADGRVVDMAARCIVCTTGARERFISFPGWTLPGWTATAGSRPDLASAIPPDACWWGSASRPTSNSSCRPAARSFTGSIAAGGWSRRTPPPVRSPVKPVALGALARMEEAAGRAADPP